MLENALEHLVKGIVDNPDDVTVDMVSGRRGQTLEVRVHPDDLGKVIGRAGRTAMALRTVPERPKWSPALKSPGGKVRYREWLPFLGLADASYWNTELVDDELED